MRNFTEKEREEIREELLDTGLELVSVYGFKKTTIEDLTEPVGIAEGTFYRFFDSKSEFFLELVVREHDRRFDRVEAELEDVSDATEGLNRLFSTWTREIENDFISETDIHDLTRSHDRRLNRDDWDVEYERFISRLRPILDALRDQTGEEFPDLSAEQLLYLLEALEAIVHFTDQVHDTDVERWNSSALYDLVIPALVKGLTAD